MRINVGIDIAKEVHWVTAIDAEGVVQIDRKLENAPAAIPSLRTTTRDVISERTRSLQLSS